LISWGLDEIPDSAVVVFDRDFRYVLVRGAALRDNGVSAADYEGMLVSDAIPAERWARLEPMYRAALEGRPEERETPGVDPDRRYLVRTRPIRDPAGAVVGGMSVATDVTALRRAEQGRMAGDRRIRLTFESSPIGMALETLDGRFLEVNPALCRMLDRDAGWLLDHGVSDVLDPEQRDADRSARHRVATAEVESMSAERHFLLPDGCDVWVVHALGLLTDPAGAPQNFLSHYLDISETRRTRERMQHLATHDVLTGLLNRAGFWAKAAPLVTHRGRAGTSLALLFIDLDDFKSVNDTIGHAGGDEVLAELGRRIESALRADDLVSRFGGDEFVALLTSIRSPQDAVGVAEHLRREMAKPIVAGGREVRLSASIGVTILGEHDLAEDALARADVSMYRAKAAGGGRSLFRA
jgi:diguanylate cyclase (GGDEF)-like protein/PAS domain S-box-containing protein